MISDGIQVDRVGSFLIVHQRVYWLGANSCAHFVSVSLAQLWGSQPHTVPALIIFSNTFAACQPLITDHKYFILRNICELSVIRYIRVIKERTLVTGSTEVRPGDCGKIHLSRKGNKESVLTDRDQMWMCNIMVSLLWYFIGGRIDF